MTEASRAFLCDLLKARSGLHLGPDKGYLLESRLLSLARAAGLDTLDDLVARLRQDTACELAQSVADAMATHETSFFRDRVPFESFRNVVLPRLIEARREARRLRIWSAAASTGQEAYSLAMILADSRLLLSGWTVEIVASDMCAAALARAMAGRYSEFEVRRGLPAELLLRHFTRTGDDWTAADNLRAAIEWRTANLLDDLRRFGRFDVVFCRNILIYLDQAAKAELMRKLAGCLARDGALCLGATETVVGCGSAFAPDPEAPGFQAPVASAGRLSSVG